MTETPIRTERRGNVLEVTLDRPKANAIDLATSRIMGDVFTEFRDDPDLRVAIVTGAGEKFFCPGWDLKAAADGDAVDGDYGKGGFGGLQELRGLNKPVIAAVNGIACGGGLELALSADIILAADHATFALPEIRSGDGGGRGLDQTAEAHPVSHRHGALLTGRWFDVEEAARWGLVNRIVPAGDLMDEARKMADDLAAGPPLVFAAIKEIVREAEDMKFQDALNRITGASSKPSSGFTAPRISWKGRAPSPKGAIRSGRASE
jgi:crotonobetainyl-CoA hydratase